MRTERSDRSLKAEQSELIAFYETRIREFEAEREDLLRRVDACTTQQATLFELDREHQQRSDEVVELQKALSNAHAFLYEERETVLELQAENEALHRNLQAASSKSRAQQPGSDHTFRPFPGSTARTGRKDSKSAHHADKQHMASVSNEMLWDQIQTLTDQLQDQKQFAAERIASLLEDRGIREAEMEAYQAAAADRSAKLCARIQHLESDLQEATKDYILARREKHETDKRAAQLHDEAMQLKIQLATSMKEVQRAAEQKLADARAEYESSIHDYSNSYCKQLHEREAEVADLTAELEQLQLSSTQQIRDLQTALKQAQESVRQLEQRRALDREGWANDVTLLRRQAAAVDRRMHQMRILDRLEDDERRDAILDTLSARAPDPTAADDSPQPAATSDINPVAITAKTVERTSSTPAQQMKLVDDGIARLTAMLQQKQKVAPGLSMKVLGSTLGSPRSSKRPQNGATASIRRPGSSGRAENSMLYSEPTLKGMA